MRSEFSSFYNLLFRSCITVAEPPRRNIRKLDIGQPTNFQHTGHLGSTEVSTKIDTLESAMKNKGGYDPGSTSNYPSEPHMPTRPIRRLEE